VEPGRKHPVAEIVSLPSQIELSPGARAVVPARLAGTIRRILVEPNQVVARDAVVAEVVSLDLQNLQLELLRHHLQLELLDKTLGHLKPLAEEGNAALSRRHYREVQAAAAATRHKRDTVQRKLETLGLTARQIQDLCDRRQFAEALPVRAPLAGAVVRFHATLGQAVKADEPLFEIHDLARPVVRGFVAERQRARVQIGQQARVRLAAAPGDVLGATLARTGQEFEADRTLSVWAELNETDTGPAPLLHGMLASLTLVVAESEPVLAVPRAALAREGMQSFLFVRRADGTFERRPVAVGRSDDRFVEITDGLSQGEPIAVEGIAGLQAAYAAIR
jgi:cobalt-zinc-cadmium efflux system membrane fusion protein